VTANARKKPERKASRKSSKTYRGSGEEELDAVYRGASSGSDKKGNVGERDGASSGEYDSGGDTFGEVGYSNINSNTNSNSKRNTNSNIKSDTNGKIDDEGNNLLTSNLVREADKVIGVKYRYGGTSPSRGFDCSGFTSYVYDKMNIAIPRTSTDQSRAGKRIRFKDAGVGDLVFFGTGSRVTHVGIVVARTSKRMEVVHSTSSSGVRRDEIFGSKYWSSRALWAVDFKSLQR